MSAGSALRRRASSATILSSFEASSAATGAKTCLQLRIVALRGEGLRPVEGEIEVAAAVVERAEFASGATCFPRGIWPVAASSVSARTLAFGVPVASARCSKRGGQGEEFAERIPAQVVFGGELLHVLGRGAAGAGFEQAAAVHQRDDGEHLGAGADFEDGEEVGEVVAQDIAGDRDGVLAAWRCARE